MRIDRRGIVAVFDSESRGSVRFSGSKVEEMRNGLVHPRFQLRRDHCRSPGDIVRMSLQGGNSAMRQKYTGKARKKARGRASSGVQEFFAVCVSIRVKRRAAFQARCKKKEFVTCRK